MRNSQSRKDRDLRHLLSQAIVRPGFRPENNDEIDAMLSALEGDQFSDDQVKRILQKAKGNLPIAQRDETPAYNEQTITQETGELLALHRAGGDEIPEEIEKKLEAFRHQAEEDEDDETDDPTDELET